MNEYIFEPLINTRPLHPAPVLRSLLNECSDDAPLSHAVAIATPYLNRADWGQFGTACPDQSDYLLGHIMLDFRNRLFQLGWSKRAPTEWWPLCKGNAELRLGHNPTRHGNLVNLPHYVLWILGEKRPSKRFYQKKGLSPLDLAAHLDAFVNKIC